MVQNLEELMTSGQVQGQMQSNYAQALRDKRAYQQISSQAGEQFAGSLSSENPVALNPADVFGAYQSFNAAVKPMLTADQDILSQLAQIVQQREEMDFKKQQTTDSTKSLAEVLGLTEKAKALGYDTSVFDKQLEEYGLKPSGKKAVTEEEKKVVDLIDEILASDTKSNTGASRIAEMLPGTKAKTTKAKIDQLKSQLALTIRERLKGQGTITDKETEMIEKAVAALDPTQSDEAFRKELAKIRADFAGESESSGLDEDDEALINKYKGK